MICFCFISFVVSFLSFCCRLCLISFDWKPSFFTRTLILIKLLKVKKVDSIRTQSLHTNIYTHFIRHTHAKYQPKCLDNDHEIFIYSSNNFPPLSCLLSKGSGKTSTTWLSSFWPPQVTFIREAVSLALDIQVIFQEAYTPMGSTDYWPGEGYVLVSLLTQDTTRVILQVSTRI